MSADSPRMISVEPGADVHAAAGADAVIDAAIAEQHRTGRIAQRSSLRTGRYERWQ